MREFIKKKQQVKDQINANPHFDDVAEEEMRWKTEQEQQNIAGCKGNISCSGEGLSAASTMASKKQTQLGPINLYFTKESNEAMQQRKEKEAKVIDEAKKKLRENAVQKICRWMYDAGLPFNVVNYESLGPAIEAIGQYGPGMKPPSYYEIRVKYLKKELEHTNNILKAWEEDQTKYECSLMADGWTDRKHRSLINFLVNSPKGTKFIGSVDASSYSHTGSPLLDMLRDFIAKRDMVAGPLIKVLRLVDGEKEPPMDYIYEAMDRAKEAIAASFSNIEEKYQKKIDIIDARWDIQLHRPLHAAGYYLNPEFYYSNPSVEQDKEVMGGLFKCIERLIPDGDMQDKLIEELAFYKKQKAFLVSLWRLDKEARELQLHTKRRNRLEQKRLNDLVYIKYNRALRRRYDARDTIDPIALDDIDESNEWLLGRLNLSEEDGDEENARVFEDDDLTWGDVARASGVDEDAYTFRPRHSKVVKNTTSKASSSKATKKASTSSKATTKHHLIDEDEEEEEINFDDTNEEDLDCYKSNSDRENKTNDDDEKEEIGEDLDFD
ncbi:UNVERIFIED_CONTAM: hypothetical protein Slati_0896900 [Sesamum latifolium]|uniref:DUF659 domain-containing protein n=1 Tax=Sesamum latifolium TaxID=2727402 RepID=A0AAW2XN64_9LAMI